MSTHDSIDFSQLPGVIICKDKEGRFLWANDQAVKLAGFDDFSQLAGKTDYDESISWHKGAEGYRKLETKAMDTGRLAAGVEVASKDGIPARFLTYKTPVRNSDGEIAGVMLVSLEVTDELLQQLNNALK
jgi:two-component system, OmpR family, aerobic respiration control sensor histidine kinase ArcB